MWGERMSMCVLSGQKEKKEKHIHQNSNGSYPSVTEFQVSVSVQYFYIYSNSLGCTRSIYVLRKIELLSKTKF